jgi:hypothetical protein
LASGVTQVTSIKSVAADGDRELGRDYGVARDESSHAQSDAGGGEFNAATERAEVSAASSDDDHVMHRLAVYVALLVPLAYVLFVWVPSNGVRAGVIPVMVMTSLGCLVCDGIIKAFGWKADPKPKG